MAPRGFEMKNSEKGFGVALLLESFAGVVFVGVLASHMLSGHGKIAEMYDAVRFSPGNIVMMMDSRPALFNRYRHECDAGQILPDNACRRIKMAYEINGPVD